MKAKLITEMKQMAGVLAKRRERKRGEERERERRREG
jgi:hypothetical protein